MYLQFYKSFYSVSYVTTGETFGVVGPNIVTNLSMMIHDVVL